MRTSQPPCSLLIRVRKAAMLAWSVRHSCAGRTCTVGGIDIPVQSITAPVREVAYTIKGPLKSRNSAAQVAWPMPRFCNHVRRDWPQTEQTYRASDYSYKWGMHVQRCRLFGYYVSREGKDQVNQVALYLSSPALPSHTINSLRFSSTRQAGSGLNNQSVEL